MNDYTQVLSLVLKLLLSHPVVLITLLAVLWIFSAMGSAMPTPTHASTPLYTFFYKTVQGMFASLKQIGLKRILAPQVVMPPTEVSVSSEPTTSSTNAVEGAK